VYEYAAGKADWGSFGLALEGARPSATRVGAHARTDVPTCRPGDRMPEVRERAAASGWDAAFVTTEHGVVLGLLGRTALGADDDVSAEEAMTLGPSTVRPSYELEAALERMRKKSLTYLPVTRPDGVLIGVIRRDDVHSALGADAGK
jgi:CBS domain-containing protein